MSHCLTTVFRALHCLTAALFQALLRLTAPVLYNCLTAAPPAWENVLRGNRAHCIIGCVRKHVHAPLPIPETSMLGDWAQRASLARLLYCRCSSSPFPLATQARPHVEPLYNRPDASGSSTEFVQLRLSRSIIHHRVGDARLRLSSSRPAAVRPRPGPGRRRDTAAAERHGRVTSAARGAVGPAAADAGPPPRTPGHRQPRPRHLRRTRTRQ